MDNRIERDLRLLKGYAIVTTVVMTVLCLAAFSGRGEKLRVDEIQGQRAKFDVVDAERVNIVEPNGLYRLVISSGARGARSATRS